MYPLSLLYRSDKPEEPVEMKKPNYDDKNKKFIKYGFGQPVKMVFLCSRSYFTVSFDANTIPNFNISSSDLNEDGTVKKDFKKTNQKAWEYIDAKLKRNVILKFVFMRRTQPQVSDTELNSNKKRRENLKTEDIV